MNHQFPFSAVVGQDELRLALLANAVNPQIGGVLVRGERGTAKSTAVRALASLLPEIEVVAGCAFNCDPANPNPGCPDGPHELAAATETVPVPLVELPVGATADRLTGSLNIERALADGESVFEPGLLAGANRGILYVDEVNLLADHLIDLLLDVAAMGVNYVERDGVSVRHPSRFVLVGTMNPEEGDLRPQLLDRFALSVEVKGMADVESRGEVVRRRLRYEADPAGFGEQFRAEDELLRGTIVRARARLADATVSDRILHRINKACFDLGVDGLRADIVTAKTALTLAALDSRDDVNEDDLLRAAAMALGHRKRKGPLEPAGIDQQELSQALGSPDDGDDPGDDDPSGGSSPPGQSDGSSNGDEANVDRSPSGATAGSPTDGTAPADASAQTEGSKQGGTGSQTKPPARPMGRSPETLKPSGHYNAPLLDTTPESQSARRLKSRSNNPPPTNLSSIGTQAGHSSDIAIRGTLRAAAPYQSVRGRGDGKLILRASDLRSHLRDRKVTNCVILVLDLSGSMAARKRMSAVKSMVISLLEQTYRKRDRIGVIGFSGEGAFLALAPSTRFDHVAQLVRDLPASGRTPIASGIELAATVARRELLRDSDCAPRVVLVTDGRANAGTQALPAAVASAQRLAASGIPLVVVDTESGPVRLRLAEQIARAGGTASITLDSLALGSEQVDVDRENGARSIRQGEAA